MTRSVALGVAPTSGSFASIEQGIARVSARMPHLPRQDVTLLRLNLHVARKLSDALNETLRPFQLSHVGLTTLMMLYGSEHGEVNPSMLCSSTGETRTNMTRIADDLVARGLVERRHSSDDRRRVVLILTSSGEALIKRMLPALWKRIGRALAGFSAGDKALLESLLKRELVGIEQT
jgi:MarR family transcriptional repressor of emrRAB